MNTMKETSQNTLCPICEEGTLSEHTEYNVAEYSGVTRNLPLLMSICEACGSEIGSTEQTRQNKRVMTAFKKEVDGLLTGEQVRELRKGLGINQKQARAIFGGGPTAFSKYESDDIIQSEAMDNLLRAAKRFPMVAAWLAKEHGEVEIASRIQVKRFPCCNTKSFVEPALKSAATAKTSENSFQSYTLGNKMPQDEDKLYAG